MLLSFWWFRASNVNFSSARTLCLTSLPLFPSPDFLYLFPFLQSIFSSFTMKNEFRCTVWNCVQHCFQFSSVQMHTKSSKFRCTWFDCFLWIFQWCTTETAIVSYAAYVSFSQCKVHNLCAKTARLIAHECFICIPYARACVCICMCNILADVCVCVCAFSPPPPLPPPLND